MSHCHDCGAEIRHRSCTTAMHHALAATIHARDGNSGACIRELAAALQVMQKHHVEHSGESEQPQAGG